MEIFDIFQQGQLKPQNFFKTISVAYLGFEITGANFKFHRCFLQTVSYNPILSVIDLNKYTYQHKRIFLFLEPNDQIKKIHICTRTLLQIILQLSTYFSYVSLTFTQIFDLQSSFFYEATEMQTCLLKQPETIFQPLQSRYSKSL